jgi:hypothetical protein
VTSCIQLIAQLFAHCPVRHREQRLEDAAGVKTIVDENGFVDDLARGTKSWMPKVAKQCIFEFEMAIITTV